MLLNRRLMDMWAYHYGVRLDFSRSGKSTDTAFVELFNGSLRDRTVGSKTTKNTKQINYSWENK